MLGFQSSFFRDHKHTQGRRGRVGSGRGKDGVCKVGIMTPVDREAVSYNQKELTGFL